MSETTIRHTNINLDRELVDEAAAVLGTARTTDTVHAALRAVIDHAARERLELRNSTQNATEFINLRTELDALPDCPIGIDEWQRALDVYEQLALQGGLHHRSPDLLIAAAAEAAGIPVLHYDQDYDRIAAITGQGVQWLAPRGSHG